MEKEGTSCSPTNFDESTCSFKSESPKSTALNSKAIGSISLQELPVTSPSGASEFKTDGLQAYSTLEGQKDAFWPQISSDSVEEVNGVIIYNLLFALLICAILSNYYNYITSYSVSLHTLAYRFQ